MAQVWILLHDVHPMEAITSRKDESVCGNCQMRPQGVGASVRSCYVHLGAVAQVWKSYQNGNYQRVTPARAAKMLHLPIRLGAYGDPAALPAFVLAPLTAKRRGWTSYTSSWDRTRQQSISMASCRTSEETKKALALGYNVYLSMPPRQEAMVPAGAVLCPKTELAGKTKMCFTCMLCNGRAPGSKPLVIWTPMHGSVAQMSAIKKVFSLPVLQDVA